mmetsp:Transcript_24978/g.44984  ORF Transcript_24978/g.44984 Transcript_24978/m.44984 type:complete len:543 (+) Transcript_24978:151-1779(+)|eukprot:CAMPEP_0196142386 /NCGR_PEP_ID=MMETSP0910-20130528/11577_1 /TAXON_ID=49265 /ORGANISM="Thalassiosira rotula, Strain GSO102" /LENGTH=542 /DNA_ID=CAMNT_0041403689 /DNA_START=146 /DNA_END=1774 /DNA_ORIENTATION=-
MVTATDVPKAALPGRYSSTKITSTWSLVSLSLSVVLSGSPVDAFAPPQSCLPGVAHQFHQRTHVVSLLSHKDQNAHDSEDVSAESHQPSPLPTRRDALRQSVAATAALGFSLIPSSPASALPPIASFSNPFEPKAASSNGGTYVPGKRCTAYSVDATIPPSLIPYRASREAAILKNLGMGGGTPKAPFIEDDVNLNNILNKAVFGSINTVKNAVDVVTGDVDGTNAKSGPNYQSFVFFGANFDDTYTASPEKTGQDNADASLAVGLLTDITKPKVRSGNTALGLAFSPQSGQGALDDYLKSNGSEDEAERALVEGLKAVGADEGLAQRHLPILRFAKKKRFALLALAPELSDLETVQKGGLQSLDSERRDTYVADAQGFIALTQEPKFKLYADKSLLKDYKPSPSEATDEAATKAGQANFFAERILVHEACATAISKWATSRPNSMVVTIAPIPDVRFMGGMNGRVPRVCQHLNPASLVDEEAVTTILLNPNARETLSESKFLRLEIGTAPNNWTYQTKIADYLWFSSMPKVNMLPRMMNEQ